jgi:glutamyl/glutaminyl-tRNA synthetase
MVSSSRITHHASPLPYRGRLAPSPTGFLHLGHARTFWVAQQRSQSNGGTLILRNEDLDVARCRPQFVSATLEDLRWFGFQWQEGPDCGGPCGPYNQSERRPSYRAAFQILRDRGLVYPCACSRQDVLRALQAPHAGEDEPIYPGTCRPRGGSKLKVASCKLDPSDAQLATDNLQPATPVNWRFRVPDGEPISFVDGHFGPQQFVAGKGFGDFVVWRQDDLPAYQLAVVVDDAAMRITEVVRGEDLLKSTARQLLLYRALALTPPQFYHCPLVTDESGARLAKRHDALSLRSLRAQGRTPEQLRKGWGESEFPGS